MADAERGAIERFVAAVAASNPMHARFLTASVASLSEGHAAELAGYLALCARRGLTEAEVVDAYNTVVNDTQREQVHFLRERRYRHATFAEVAADVYFNPAYMRRYMYGLAISAFLWPNHRAMHDFFLARAPRDVGGDYLEVGPGHGYYFARAARLGGYERMTGVDISATSLELTASALEHYGVAGERVRLIEADFLAHDLELPDPRFLVMGEVLEHVEQPQRFLERLVALAGPQTSIYVTTCVNAPAIDHIYLFEAVEQVERLLADAGLRIEHRLHVPYQGKTLEQCARLGLAVNVAYFARRA